MPIADFCSPNLKALYSTLRTLLVLCVLRTATLHKYLHKNCKNVIVHRSNNIKKKRRRSQFYSKAS